MDIKYLGHSSFYIKTKNAKIVTDPFAPESTGLAFPKVKADIVTVSHDHADHSYVDGVSGEPLVISWPGEYEKNEVRITGFKTYHDANMGQDRGENVMYKFEVDGVSLLHCGDLGHLLDDKMVDELGSIDIVMVPVGGFFTIDAKQAMKVVNNIEAGVVIPMHYNREDLDQNKFGNLQDLSVFLKEIGAEDVEKIDQFTVKKDLISSEGVEVVLL